MPNQKKFMPPPPPLYSLKIVYRQIITEDITYAVNHHIEDKLWRYICYAKIEQVRSKLRKVIYLFLSK